jgi:tyrosyl-tRNA synthetase
MASSGKQVKDALGRNAVTINNHAVESSQNGDVPGCFAESAALFGRFYLVRLGKKKYHLFEVAQA